MDRTRQVLATSAGALTLILLTAGCASEDELSAPRITGPDPSLADGTVGEEYSATFTASGTAPIVWAVVDGAVPGGLFLDAETGALSGTPRDEVDATFTVRARNVVGETTQQFALTVEAAPVQGTPPEINTTSLPDGTVGVAYEQTLAATGTAPITWSTTAGALPAGTVLGQGTGVLAGTPTGAGQFAFTALATNSAGTDTQQLTVQVHEAPTAPSIQGPSSPLPDAVVDSAYSQQFTATGTEPISWSVSAGSLPTGLQLDPDSGALTGTPTVAGLANFTVTATNGVGQDAQACELTTAQPPSLTELDPTEAPIGTTITVRGSGFDTTPGNNTVEFSSTAATVLTATATELTVQVPQGISGDVPVRVTVDSLPSNTRDFTVDPATVWFVDTDAQGNDDGSSWTDAFTDLQGALAAADGNDEVWVAAGTYVTGDSREDSFVLGNGLKLYGGFAGTEGRRSDSDPIAHVTVLSGDVDGDDDNWSNQSDNSYCVVRTGDGNVIDGFTIQGGYANGQAAQPDSGGGIHSTGGDLTVSRIKAAYCRANHYGGALYHTTGRLLLSDSLFEQTYADIGGALWIGGSPTESNRVERCILYRNDASGGAGARDESSGTTWRDTLFCESFAWDGGGGLHLGGTGTHTVRSCTFYRCYSDFHGASSIQASSTIGGLDVLDSIFWDSHTWEYEIDTGTADVSVTNCILESGLQSVHGNVSDGGGNTNNDPEFVDTQDLDGSDDRWATGDDGLVPGDSGAAVDAGTDQGASATDITGTQRPVGDHVDIGAYERALF